MTETLKPNNFLYEDAPAFLVEYRGNFLEEMSKISYGIGSIITDTLALVSIPLEFKEQLRKDVPSITFISPRSVFLLQDIPPSSIDSISTIKINPYLNLTGNDVIVGMIDTGIDYLNKEFIREDNSSRILNIWDQTILNTPEDSMYIGKIYTNDDINRAIEEHKKGADPYKIVPSKDEEYHGTQMASIIGARGYNEKIEGIAKDCDFAIVKLLPSPNYSKRLRENNLPYVPVYNNSEVLSAIEYLVKIKKKLKRPMVIYLGVGSQDVPHDGSNIIDKYISYLSNQRGLVLVTGTGNNAADEGHVSNYIKNEGSIETVELLVTKEMKLFNFDIWVKKPNVMSFRISSPSGEVSNFMKTKLKQTEEKFFILSNTKLTIEGNNPQEYTGHQNFSLTFHNIKSGIWKIELRGDHIIDGRYDIWLPNKLVIPEGTKFLQSTPYNTLTIPSTSTNVISVSYYNSITNTSVSSSGKGFNTNGFINPDIITAGINISTVSKPNSPISTASGSSAATAIIAGVCTLILQWGIIYGNDTTMNSTKIKSLLIYGAQRDPSIDYPNETEGYGRLDLFKSFNILGGNYIENISSRLYIRLPKNII